MPKHLTPWPDEKIAELRSRFENGEAYLSISLAMDVDVNTIMRRLAALGLKRGRKVSTPIEERGAA